MNAQHQQLVQAVRSACAEGRTLRVRAGGSKDFWGAPLHGQVLDVRGYSGIVSYEPSELVVTARCGTPLAELEAVLAEKGQCLAFEPPHFAHAGASTATVGGMVAAGLSGPARASVGAVRDFVLGVRMLNGLGQDLYFGGQVMKNVAGYDISRLMVGSWGTLGVLTEVSLKVMPVAPMQATLLCAGLGQQAALDLLQRWGGQPLPLNASAWVHDPALGADCLFVRLRGAVAAVQAALTRMGSDAQALGAQVSRQDDTAVAADWHASGEQTLPFFSPPTPQSCLWRLSLPPTTAVLHLPELTQASPYIEWHGAQRWLWAAASAAQALQQVAQQAGGHATLFRASAHNPLADKAHVASVGLGLGLGAAQQRIAQAVQKQFDPQGVFNTGRMGI